MPCKCSCPVWVVVRRNWSRSAFNGYREAWSRYSDVRCQSCDSHWRTKGKFVHTLPDDPGRHT